MPRCTSITTTWTAAPAKPVTAARPTPSSTFGTNWPYSRNYAKARAATIAGYAFGLTRLALKREGTGDQWFHHDMLGSIADLSDASGTVVEAKTFTPYGKQETITATAEGG